jgi:transcriptional antiterminator RfaH
MLESHHPPTVSDWYVIRSHQGQEWRAQANLSLGSIETFLPCVRTASRRDANRSGREALFPQYLFARFHADMSLHDVTFTRGVQSVVRVGGQLATVDDNVIAFFRSRVDEHGLIPLQQKLAPGELVTINCGPFADLVGVIERSLPARERVIVLLTSVSSAMRVEVPAGDLRTR